MNLLDRYMTELSMRRSTEINGEINVSILLALEEKHLPRIQEIVRLSCLFLGDVAESQPSDDIDENEMLINRADKLLEKIEDLAKDGLGDLFIESIEMDADLS